MPAAYAHHRFGNQCIEAMPEKLKQVCLKYRELYDFGVHGPDILFYHHPLKTTPVNSYGRSLHHLTGAAFFEHAAEVFSEQDQKDRMLSYLLGFLAHFTLDAHCHGYINEMPERIGLSHNYIESQYEAFLMKKDGWNPVTVDRSESLIPSPETAAVISRFYPFSVREILTALKGQRSTMKLLYSPGQLKKQILRRVICLLKISGDFGDLFLDEKEDPFCRETNEEILHLQETALQDYPEMMRVLVEYLYGRGDLNDAFIYDFEGELQ